MPSIIHEHELDEPDQFDPDEFDDEFDHLFKVTSPDTNDEVTSADEACDLILDLVEEQFWDWFANPERGRRFKPRVKVYEVC